jgi:anti-anti-sigma factor
VATRDIQALVRERDGTAAIELAGRIDAGADAALSAAYAEAAGLGRGPILLDFADTDYINSTGIALIVGLLARARADAREIQACGLSAHYREIFEITRLADFMRILPDAEGAPTTRPGGDA